MSDAIVAIIFKNNNNILYTHIMHTQLMLELIHYTHYLTDIFII